jgi:hypothetical protein
LGLVHQPNLQPAKLIFKNLTMKTPKIITLLGITTATVGSIAATTVPAFSVTLGTLNGTLADADAIASVIFTAPSTPVSFQTTSYIAGNFSPRVTLFDASDNYFDEYIASGDLNFDLTLTPGNYRAVISTFGRFFDTPANVNFSEGFSGTGDFELNASGTAPRGSDYALTISTVNTTLVPEPSSLIGTALAGVGVVLLRRRLSIRSRKPK